jgi:hypothetical protein
MDDTSSLSRVSTPSTILTVETNALEGLVVLPRSYVAVLGGKPLSLSSSIGGPTCTVVSAASSVLQESRKKSLELSTLRLWMIHIGYVYWTPCTSAANQQLFKGCINVIPGYDRCGMYVMALALLFFNLCHPRPSSQHVCQQ